MPQQWKGHTFYSPAELAELAPEEREAVLAEHRANPVQAEELSPAYREASLARARARLVEELTGEHREAS
ncbi:hypothetical protein [Kineosporia babensis]|uniref:Uncharacterized protein n=1 Tax=Kineosporia babensis TaxID=499548 RepID=A0A9X1NLF6_9ACTN|nr:hypothetical protein [Kineosporia babensis]MCD5317197.1 hypothetical protein [Kineosporia babensis]